ncbi:MAG: hypothetical protein O7G87_04030 [bacterium]|nr:hypothetical protein [bacterium]
MKHFSTVLLFVLILALMPTQALFAQSATVTLNADTSCVTYNDPKDPSVPAGKDVRQLEITVKGDEVQVRMTAYADWDLFFSNLKFTGGDHGPVSIGCYPNLIRVSVGEHPHAFIEQRGIPVVKDTDYRFRFSWRRAFGSSSEVAFRLWSVRDLAPDVKTVPDSATSQLLTLHR